MLLHEALHKAKEIKKALRNQKRKGKKKAYSVAFEIPFCSMIYWSLSFVSGSSLEDSSLQCNHVVWLDRDACLDL